MDVEGGICTVCPKGSKCPDPRSPPVACPAGTFGDEAGAVECKLCDAGKFASDSGREAVCVVSRWLGLGVGLVGARL